MQNLRRSISAVLMLCAVLAGSPALAQATAQQFVEQRQEAASALLRRPASDARNQQLSQLFDDMLDYQELARRSLGRHWGERNESERQQFIGLLEQLVERAYRDNLQRTSNFEVRFLGSEQQGDATLVRTEARSRTNRRAPAVQIDYSLRQVNGRWRVFDIHTDGVSMVSNYRSQFNRIITREGWDGMIQRMRDRAQGEGSDI